MQIKFDTDDDLPLNKAINGGKENDYGKDYMKIRFNSDDDLLLSKPLKFHAVTIIICC